MDIKESFPAFGFITVCESCGKEVTSYFSSEDYKKANENGESKMVYCENCEEIYSMDLLMMDKVIKEAYDYDNKFEKSS